MLRTGHCSSFGRHWGFALIAIAAITACASDPTPSETVADTSQVSVAAENRISGTADWKLTRLANADSLAVWASPYDAASGDTLQVYIRSISGSLTVEVYRLGWYQGLGGRRLVDTTLALPQDQPACTPPFPGPLSCPWKVSYRVPIEPGWTGGWYIVRIHDLKGESAAYPFVVKSRRSHAFLAVVPQFTWQAYNAFGGSSLYTTDPSTGRRVPEVSFARPFVGDASQGAMGGTRDLFAVQWLERSGLDLGYASDLDIAQARVALPLPTRGFIFLGHDEYWTWNERNNVEAFRDAGRHLMFLGPNNGYWNVRVSPDPSTAVAGQLLICYRSTSDPGATPPQQTTVRFRDPPLNRPENALFGIMFQKALPPGSTPAYIASPDSMQGPEASAFLASAGLHAGDSLGLTANAEGDDAVNNGQTPPGLQTLFVATQPLSPTLAQHYRSSFYVAPSGAGVFATGTKVWSSYLNVSHPNPRVEAITSAVLAWMAAH